MLIMVVLLFDVCWLSVGKELNVPLNKISGSYSMHGLAQNIHCGAHPFCGSVSFPLNL